MVVSRAARPCNYKRKWHLDLQRTFKSLWTCLSQEQQTLVITSEYGIWAFKSVWIWLAQEQQSLVITSEYGIWTFKSSWICPCPEQQSLLFTSEHGIWTFKSLWICLSQGQQSLAVTSEYCICLDWGSIRHSAHSCTFDMICSVHPSRISVFVGSQ